MNWGSPSTLVFGCVMQQSVWGEPVMPAYGLPRTYRQAASVFVYIVQPQFRFCCRPVG